MYWGKETAEDANPKEKRERQQVERKRCCGCEDHAMERRENGARWWCYTCGTWAIGCGR